jgi:hypothetical protein
VAGDPSRWVGGIDGDQGHRPQGGLRSRREGGNSPMFGKTASLYGVVRLASSWPAAPPRGHSGNKFRAADPPEAFLCDQHPARGVDRENTAAGPGAPESLGTVTKAGERLAAIRQGLERTGPGPRCLLLTHVQNFVHITLSGYRFPAMPQVRGPTYSGESHLVDASNVCPIRKKPSRTVE